MTSKAIITIILNVPDDQNIDCLDNGVADAIEDLLSADELSGCKLVEYTIEEELYE